MNLKAITTACLFSAINIGLMSTLAHANTTYTYGNQLDIQQVLSLTEDASEKCEVVNARMSYVDSQGHTQVLEYRKLAESCSQEG